jgi:hypothetical protein
VLRYRVVERQGAGEVLNVLWLLRGGGDYRRQKGRGVDGRAQRPVVEFVRRCPWEL